MANWLHYAFTLRIRLRYILRRPSEPQGLVRLRAVDETVRLHERALFLAAEHAPARLASSSRWIRIFTAPAGLVLRCAWPGARIRAGGEILSLDQAAINIRACDRPVALAGARPVAIPAAQGPLKVRT